MKPNFTQNDPSEYERSKNFCCYIGACSLPFGAIVDTAINFETGQLCFGVYDKHRNRVVGYIEE